MEEQIQECQGILVLHHASISDQTTMDGFYFCKKKLRHWYPRPQHTLFSVSLYYFGHFETSRSQMSKRNYNAFIYNVKSELPGGTLTKGSKLLEQDESSVAWNILFLLHPWGAWRPLLPTSWDRHQEPFRCKQKPCSTCMHMWNKCRLGISARPWLPLLLVIFLVPI